MVQLHWQQCVRAISGWASDPNAERAVYEFLLHKFYTMRFAEYCRRLNMVAELFRKKNAAQQTLRSTLKAARTAAKPVAPPDSKGGGGGSGGTEDSRGRAKATLLSLKLTEVSFEKFIVGQLKDYIVKVGGSLKGRSKALKNCVQAQLRQLVLGMVATGEDSEG